MRLRAGPLPPVPREDADRWTAQATRIGTALTLLGGALLAVFGGPLWVRLPAAGLAGLGCAALGYGMGYWTGYSDGGGGAEVEVIEIVDE